MISTFPDQRFAAPAMNQEEAEEHFLQLFRMLSDRTRLRMLSLLSQDGEMDVTELCRHLGQSQPAVSHHLAQLRMTGLAEMHREGRHNFYSIRWTVFHQVLKELMEYVGAAEAAETAEAPAAE